MDEKHVASQGWQARMFKDLEDAAVAQVVARAEDGFERPLSEAEREDLEDRLVCDAHALHANLMPRVEVMAVSLAWLLADWPLDEDLFWDRLIEAVGEQAAIAQAVRSVLPAGTPRVNAGEIRSIVANARDLGLAINRGLGRSLAKGLPEAEWPEEPRRETGEVA